MDILRSYHLTPTLMASDSGQMIWVRWYPCAPGALPYPNWHAFGSPVWESDFPVPDGVGCYPQPLIWRGKRYPAPPGQHYRGLPQWFQFGIPIEDVGSEPVGDTCQGTALQGWGGILIDGTSWTPWRAVGSVPLLCACVSTAFNRPDVRASAVSVCLCSKTGLIIPGEIHSSACLCATVSTEVVYMIQSCLVQSIPPTQTNNLTLEPTSTPLTKYDVSTSNNGCIVTGIIPQTMLTGPQWITLYNYGRYGITITSNDPASAAANTIQLPPTYGTSVTLAQYDSITLAYDPCGPTPQWVVVACTVDIDYTLQQILQYVENNYSPALTVLTAQMLETSVLLTMANINLPCSLNLAPGTWVIIGEIQCQFALSNNPGELSATAQLYDATADAVLPNSKCIIESQSLMQPFVSWFPRATIAAKLTITGSSHTVQLQAQMTTSTPGATISALGDATGVQSETRLLAIKVG